MRKLQVSDPVTVNSCGRVTVIVEPAGTSSLSQGVAMAADES